MKYLYLFAILALSLFIVGCNDDDCEESVLVECQSDFIDGVTGAVYSSETVLTRTERDVSVNCTINNLTPGYAYTLWWIVWNKPELCETPFECSLPDFENATEIEVEVLYADGTVADDSGEGNFLGTLKEGDDSGSVNDILGLPGFGGMKDAQNAEIHYVLRNHGPMIPGMIDEQIKTYMGGCTTVLDPFTEHPDEEGECADTGFAVFVSDCGL